MQKLGRRALLQGTAASLTAAATSGFIEIGRVTGASADVWHPPALPAAIVPYKRQFQNWAGDIVTDSLWTVTVTSESQVVQLANWAQANGWRIRPRGHMHNWSPISVSGSENSDTKVLMVDTTVGLVKCQVNSGSPASVTAGAGLSMDTLLASLSARGYAITHHPAVGDITVGGALAIGGHGTAVPASGEAKVSGTSYGSLPNLVLSLRAVVWDADTGAYVAKTFQRSDPQIGALLVHVGRAFVTEVTLRVGKAQQLRCQSTTGISASELFAAPGTGGRTVSSLLDRCGRIEVILFPGTSNPWVKYWTISTGWLPPFGSRWTLTPYNYTFADSIPPSLSSVIASIAQGDQSAAASFGATQLAITQAGLLSTLSGDLWGAAYTTQLYVRPTTLKETANGYAVLCRRADVQSVLSQFYAQYRSLTSQYAARGSYPMLGPLEVRVQGVDNPADAQVAGAQPAWLSPTRPRADRPDLDTVVWFDVLTFPGAKDSATFYADLEQWIFATYVLPFAVVRVEWSKGWAYTSAGGYQNLDVVQGVVPASCTDGLAPGTQFADAQRVLDSLDPGRIYSAPFHDVLFPR